MVKPDGTRTKLEESFRCAFRGLYLPLIEERNMKIHCVAAVIAITTGILLKISNIEMCLILMACGNVISKEAQNYAYEKLADASFPFAHSNIRDGKDGAAGSVLWAAIFAVLVGGIIFLPKIMGLFV